MSISEPTERHWTARWWRTPGETLWRCPIATPRRTLQVNFDFTWCHEDEWGIHASYEDDQGELIFHLGSDDLTNVRNLPDEIVRPVREVLLARRRGIPAPESKDPILSALASALCEGKEWIAGKRLRRLTQLDVDEFPKRVGRLMPRFVRRGPLTDSDDYSLTLPGLLVVDEKLRSRALMEGIYRTIAARFDADDKDDDDDVFSIDDITSQGVLIEELPLAIIVANICLLVGASADASDRTLRLPSDAEMIAANARKGTTFADYLTHAATRRQASDHYSVVRPWLTAPLWLEGDGSQPRCLPMGFESVRMPRQQLTRSFGGLDEAHPYGVSVADSEREFMRAAIDEAKKSKHEPNKTRLFVGAVVVRNGVIIARGHRGQHALGEHAEFTTLEKNLPSPAAAANATLYCTLEPCTTRNPPKNPCVDWVKRHKITRVVIGAIDPNPVIRGGGVKMLRNAGIDVALFPAEFANEVEALNSAFEREHEAQTPGAVGARQRSDKPDSVGRTKLERVLKAAGNVEVVVVGGVTELAGNTHRPALIDGQIQLGQLTEFTFEIRIPIGGRTSIPTLTVPYGLMRDAWVDAGQRTNILLFSPVMWNGRELVFSDPFAR